MKRLSLMLVATTVACSRQASVRSPAAVAQQSLECTPTAASLAAGASLASLVGEHQLKLVATAGSRAGRSVAGTLRFNPPSGMSANGAAQVALDSVGAVAPGASATITASQWQNPNGTPTIMIRFGTTGPGQVEGSFTALEVKELTSDGFRGTWRSETGGTITGGASGYFCGRRVR